MAGKKLKQRFIRRYEMSKSGSQTTTTAIPKWQEDLVREAVDQAKDIKDAAKGKPRRGRKPKSSK